MKLGAAILVVGAFAATLGSAAAFAKPPHALTGGVKHARGTTAELTGVISPNGHETTYFFQYGTTTGYGTQTPNATATGTAKVKVGATIGGLKPAATYHYRLVAVSGGISYPGKDRTFIAAKGGGRLAIKLARITAPDVYGSPFVLSGALSGIGAGSQPISLEASPFPYMDPFAAIGVPGKSNEAGAFSFRISNLLVSTQFRVVTLGPLPLQSPAVTIHVAPKVILRVKHSSVPGLVRLYGTVTPAQARNVRVLIQYEKPVRPHGKQESTSRAVTVATTKVKHGATTFSRFSIVLHVRRTGRYIALVPLARGPLVSGTSSAITLHAPAGSKH
jgi:hypothetical protein